MKHGSKGKGNSSGAHARYILRQERYDYATHQLQHTASGNMPYWAESAIHFWDAADKHEASNARLYTEFEIALPRELTIEQQRTLVRGFINAEIDDRHPYTMAIHDVDAMDGGTNPHVHVMFTTRTLDGIEREEERFFKRANSKHPEQGGAPKDRSWIKKDRLLELRESWERHANLALKRAGQDAVIDCRTLEEQRIERKPEPKLTPFEAMLWKQGVTSERVVEILLLRELAAQQNQRAAQARTHATLEEIAILKDSEAKIGETLGRERTRLESALRKRDEIDQAIERYDVTLSYAPGSKDAAYEMAKDRLWGRALDAHRDSVEFRRAERDQIAEEIENQLKQGWRAFREIPAIVQESVELFEAQQVLNAAKTAYGQFLEEMESPEAKAKCEQLAEKLYASKVEDEAKRNQLVEDALTIRSRISLHERLIADLETILDETHQELRSEVNKLSWANQLLIAPKEQQIVVGQEAKQQEEQQAERQQRQLKLNFALKLALDSEQL